MNARARILARVRGALGATAEADRAVSVRDYLQSRPLSPRPRTEGDIIARFRARAIGLATTFSDVHHVREIPAAVAGYLRGHGLPLQAVCWPELQTLDWASTGLMVAARAATASDAVGITGVVCAIAETGTLMTVSGMDTPPVTSLLPETHIAVVRASQVVAAMEEAWQRLRSTLPEMPRAVNFISGPSRTADIEQTVTLGAHGPYRVHVVWIADGEGNE